MKGTTVSKMDRKEGHGAEYNKEAEASKGQGKGRNKGQQTHAKPPPAVPGDQDPPAATRRGRGEPDSGGREWGKGQGSAKNTLVIQWVPDARGEYAQYCGSREQTNIPGDAPICRGGWTWEELRLHLNHRCGSGGQERVQGAVQGPPKKARWKHSRI
jgi:hypothetical protein